MAFCRDLCDGVVGNIRYCMTTPITRTKIYWTAGVCLGLVLLVIIICLAVPSSSPSSGRDALSSKMANGINFAASQFAENTAVEKFDKSKLDNITKNDIIGVQVFGARAGCDSKLKDAVQIVLDQLDFLLRLMPQLPSVQLATTVEQINSHQSHGYKAGLLAVSGGHSIDQRLSVLRTYSKLGVRIFSLVSPYCSVPWAKAANGSNTGNADFLKAVTRELNYQGVAVDISGLEQATQEAVIEASSAPVLAWGVGLASNFSHPLNLQDTVVNKLKDKGGVVMLTLDCSLLTSNLTCSMEHFTGLLKIAKDKKIPVGFGGTLNETGLTPQDYNTAEMKNYFDKLYDNDFDMDFLKGLAGENLKRLLSKVEEVSEKMKESGKEKEGDVIFDFSSFSGNETQCYSTRPGDGSAPTPAPTKPTEPTQKPSETTKKT